MALAVDLALGLAMATLVLAAVVTSQRAGTAVPFSDEAAHLSLLRGHLAWMQGARSWLAAVDLSLFQSDAYPNGLYAVTHLMMDEPSLTAARRGLWPFYGVPAFVGVVVGRHAWGRAGGLAYAAMIGLTPAALAFCRIYYIDVALYGAVATAVPLLAATDRLRRPGPTVLLALVSAAGLYTKWTWLVVMGPVLAVMGLGAALAAPTWRARLGWMLAGISTAAGCSAAIYALGQGPARLAWSPGGADWIVPVRLVGAGVALAAVWAATAVGMARRGRPLAPAGQAIGMAVVIALCAGPWYVLRLGALLERFGHEAEMYAARDGVSAWAHSFAFTRALLPAGEVLVPAGLLAALVARRGGWQIVASAVGVGVGFAVTVGTLPYDPRYLLPLAPLLAGMVVAGWGGLPAWLTWPGAAAIGALLWTGVGPFFTDTVPVDPTPLNGLALRIPPADPLSWPLLTGPIPEGGDPVAVDALLDSLRDACPDGCRVGVSESRGFGFSSRALSALAGFAEVPVTVLEHAGTPDIVVFVQCPGVFGSGPPVRDLTWEAPVALAPGCTLGWRRR